MRTILAILVGLTTAAFASPPLPYHATSERKTQIVDGYKRIAAGMTTTQFEAILGKSDYTTPLYEPKIYKPSQIGYSYWYIIQKLKETDSVIEEALVGVRIRTDMKNNVTFIDTFGLPPK